MTVAGRGWIAGLALLLAACAPAGQVRDAGAAPTRASQTASPAAVAPTASPAPAATPGAPDGPPAAGDAPVTPEPDTTTVTVFLTRGERLAAVSRTVPRVARIGTAAVEQLLDGPTRREAADGYATQIPQGTRLRGLQVADGVATVDLSGDFETGGGTLGLQLRLGQVVCTLEAFPTVDGVRFAVDGTVVDVVSGDGLVVDRPVTCGPYRDLPGDPGAAPEPTAAPS